MWSLTTGIACSWLILMVVVATGSHIALVLRMTIAFRNRIIWFLRAAAAVTTMLTACLLSEIHVIHRKFLSLSESYILRIRIYLYI